MNAMTEAPSASSLDRAAIARLRALARELDPSLFAEIMGTFLDDAAKYRTALRSAMDAQDAAALEHTAHAMKGASMSIGALALASISAQVEHAAEGGTLSLIPPLIIDIEAEIRRVQADIALELSAPA